MRHLKVKQNTPEWLEARKGKIMGSSLLEVVTSRAGTKEQIIAVLDKLGIDYPKNSKGNPDTKTKVGEFERLLPETEAVKMMLDGEKKLGFYKLVADRISVPANEEDRMDRGHRLEQEALDIYTKKTGNEVERVGIFLSKFSDQIGQSPDGATKVGKIYPIEQEVKCLSTAMHLKVYDEQEIPKEYWAQRTQYFVVNENLKTLDFIFYDDRIPEAYECRHFIITIKREDIQKFITKYRIYEQMLLEGVEKMVERLTF